MLLPIIILVYCFFHLNLWREQLFLSLLSLHTPLYSTTNVQLNSRPTTIMSPSVHLTAFSVFIKCNVLLSWWMKWPCSLVNNWTNWCATLLFSCQLEEAGMSSQQFCLLDTAELEGSTLSILAQMRRPTLYAKPLKHCAYTLFPIPKLHMFVKGLCDH